MKYRKGKYGEEISVLGFGCMRFPKNGISIKMDESEKLILEAIDNGINYYDTAYMYPGNEVALGEILAKNKCREKVKIATKLPVFRVGKKEKIDEFFNEELKRLQTDYIDYYLMHMITDIVTWEKLKRLGIEEWIKDKKEKGQIKQLGFSYHGNTEMFLKLLDAYDWDFCQIQYNYLDEHSQAGRKGMMAAYEKGIPVIIMEPLRGGKLVDYLPQKAKKLIKENDRKWSAAEWAFRWLMEQKEITCVLSGMNTMDMLQENIKTASEVQIDEFKEEDKKLIYDIKEAIKETENVGCTGCGYCMPCPKGVDIPSVFRSFNLVGTEGRKSARRDYMFVTALKKVNSGASMCIGCGLCEKHCPQSIEIRKELKNAKKELEGIVYHGAKMVAKFLYK